MDIFSTEQSRKNTAIALIGLGVLFVAAQIFNISLIGLAWPLFVIGPGAIFLYFATRRDGDDDQAGLIFPGIIITGTGLILLYQNITGHWASWAYVWTLYPAMVGLALQYHGRRTGEREEIGVGREMFRWALAAFGVAWLFFEVLIFGQGTSFALLAIALGAYILYRERAGQPVFNSGLRAETTKRKNVTVPSSDRDAHITDEREEMLV